MGGAEICLMDMLSSIRSAESAWQLSLIVGEDGPLAQQARAAGVHTVVAPFPGPLARLGDSASGLLPALWSSLKAMVATAAYVRKLRRVAAQLQPNLIHTNGFKMHVIAAWIRPKHSRLIWHVHDYVSSRPLMKTLLQIHARCCSAVISNSHSVAGDVQAVCGKQMETVCIYNAVDLERYSPPRSGNEEPALDSLAGFQPATGSVVRIGLVATMAHWKGHTTFLRALARLPEDLPFRAYIIGGPIYQTDNSQQSIVDLRQLANQLGIGQKTGFTGYLPDTAGAMRALDILVHASTQPEPFGRVIIEGMACGRAVICSAAGGAAEIITEGEDALAHAPGDVVGLAERMLQLINDADLRERLGRAARATAESRFDRSRLGPALLNVYGSVLQRAVSAPTSRSARPRFISVSHR